MATKSASVPRLPGLPSPTLRELLLSGWMMFTSKQEEVFLKAGTSYVLPLNKGFVVLPELYVEDMVGHGDPYAMLQLAMSIAEQTSPTSKRGVLCWPKTTTCSSSSA